MAHLPRRFEGFTVGPRTGASPLRVRWLRVTVVRLRLEAWLPVLDGGWAWHALLCTVAFLALVAGGAMAAGGLGLIAQHLQPNTAATPALWAAAGAAGTAIGGLLATATWWWGEVRAHLLWRLLNRDVLDARSQEAMALYAASHQAPPSARGVQARCVWHFAQDGLALLRCGWQAADDSTSSLKRWPDPHNRPRIARADLLPSWALLCADLLWDQQESVQVSSAPQDLHSAHARLARAGEQQTPLSSSQARAA